jgi:hypothetical protein
MERLNTIAGVHPGWRARLEGLLEEGGYRLTSVWRSQELQARFFWCKQNGCPPGKGCHGVPGDCPGANPPGESNHEYAEEVNGETVPASLAVDLTDSRGDNFALAHRLGPTYGIHFPIPSERWHAQPIEVESSFFEGSSPFGPVATYIADPWDDLFVPIIAS